MTKINPFQKIFCFIFIAITLNGVSECSSDLVYIQRCYDPKCSEPISRAKTILKYTSNHPNILSFGNGDSVMVYSKGKNTLYWGVQIKGKRGLAPATFLKETSVLHSNLTHEVPLPLQSPFKIEENGNRNVQGGINQDQIDIKASTPMPSPTEKSEQTPAIEVPPAATVIHGTTILEGYYVTQNIDATVVPTEMPPHGIEPNTVVNVINESSDVQQSDSQKLEDQGSKKLDNAELTETVPVATPDLIQIANGAQVSKINEVSVDEAVNKVNVNISLETQQEKGKDELKNKGVVKVEEKIIPIGDASPALQETQPAINTETVLEQKENKTTEALNNTTENQIVENVQNNVTKESIISLPKVDLIDSTKELSKQDNTADIKKDEVQRNEIKSAETTANNTESNGGQEETLQIVISTTTEAPASHLPSEMPSQSVSKDDKADEVANITYSAVLENNSSNYVESEDNLKSGGTSIPEIVSTGDLLASTEISQEKFSSPSEEKDVNLGLSVENTTIVQNDTLKEGETVAQYNTNNETVVVNDPKTFVQHNETVELVNDQEVLPNSAELLQSSQEAQVDPTPNQPSNINMFFGNRNLLNVEEVVQTDKEPQVDVGTEVPNEEIRKDPIPQEDTTTESVIETASSSESSFDYYGNKKSDELIPNEAASTEDVESLKKPLEPIVDDSEVLATVSEACISDEDCGIAQNYDKQESFSEEDSIVVSVKKITQRDYWETILYVGITALTTLLFSLGYYYIENMRRDGQLIAKINKLEKELLISTKECTVLDESLKATKNKLTSIEDESFGSNEMVLSLRADLEALQKVKDELEDQNATLEKDLESATEAGLELERMLREVLSSNNEVNPLAQSVEDLQARLNAQQAANESLTNVLALKAQENESLSTELTDLKKKFEELEVELSRVSEELKVQTDLKSKLEETLNNKVEYLEKEIKEITADKSALRKELKAKEMEAKDLEEVIRQLKSNDLDLDKLYDVSRIKAEATQLREERDELQIRLNEVEGAHLLLEEHMKLIKEEVSALSEQCKAAEKEKKDAETRLEVLSNFFKEKEAQRQKEEAVWLQKQGEVMSTVERIHTMQNEIQSYKQQIEILKREIVDQEREYKSQISALETKVHEQWVVARQTERRLEESKAESSQLRNRLTLIEKNINDIDPETKLHRLETNGDTTTSSGLYLGEESSGSPIMFSGSSNVPPPPPHSYMFGPPPLPPHLPPPLPSGSGMSPYDISQRPPPLGGRLSSPAPMPPPLHPPPPPASSSRYDNAGSPPPPLSPQLYPPYDRHRSPPPHGAFAGDHRIHPSFPPPLLAPPRPLLPPPFVRPSGPLLPPPPATSSSWGDETLPPMRNFGSHPNQRDQRPRNHKGSLHSSGESLDKSHHSGKV